MRSMDAATQRIVEAEFLGRDYRVRLLNYAPGYRRRSHGHDVTGITLVIDGRLRERAHRCDEEASALSVVVKPAGTMHENDVGPRGARTVLVEIRDEAALIGREGRLGPWRWLHAGAGMRPLLGLAHALLHPGNGPHPDDLVLELLGELADLPAPRPGDSPPWIRRAREALDELVSDGIEVRELACRLRVHPVALTRAFRRAYGVPVTTYRRRARLRRAADQVAGTDHSLCSIAHASGYADQAHMSRDVRSTTGLTPSGLRAVARALNLNLGGS